MHLRHNRIVVLDGLLAVGNVLDLKKRHVANVSTDLGYLLKADCGNEARRLPGLGNLAIELVDLFEGQTLGLVDESPDEEEAEYTAAAPDEEDLGLEIDTLWGRSGVVVDKVWGGVGYGPVEKPVGGGSHGETFGTDLQREDLTGDYPGHWAPRACEEENVDTDERDGGVLSRQVGDWSDSADDGNDELADGHTSSAEEQKVAATPSLDEVETGKGGTDVDAGRDHGDDEWLGETRTLEVGGTVVEDEVDTGELLQSLETTASDEALENVALEAVKVGGLAQGQLVLVVSSYFAEFLAEGGVINVESSESGESLGGLLRLALLDTVSRSLGQDEHTSD